MADIVGFIGLGIMGKPMVTNLLRTHEVWVYDIAAAPVEELAGRGAKAASLAEIAAGCDVVCTMLPNGAIVRSTLFGDGGIAGGLRPGGLVVDLSSVTPTDSRACAEQLAARGVGFLDAPVSGGEPKAIDGTLAIMVGGAQSDFDRALPVLQGMGTAVTHVGDVGAGSITKLANQMIVNLTIAAVGEAMVFARKAGVDPATVYAAIRGGLAGSAVLDAKAPMMAEHDFTPGGTLTINRKDIGNVLATAHDLEIPVPMAAQLYEVMQSLASKGRLGLDHSGLVTYFEDLAGVSVADFGQAEPEKM